MRRPWRRRCLPTAQPTQALQFRLLNLFLASLAGVLLVFAVVVRAGVVSIAMTEIRSELSLIGEDFESLPPPTTSSKRHLQASQRDLVAAHQQVEWFVGGESTRPVARLGEMRTLGPLPPRRSGQRLLWQSGPSTIALVQAAEEEGSVHPDPPRVWLRISQGLQPLERRIQQVDLAIGLAICLTLALSAVCATLLARRVVEPLERSLRSLREFEIDASHELRGPLAALAANAELGLLDCQDDSQRRRFESIASATDQMLHLVEDLLLLARQEERPLADPQRIDLAELVTQQLDVQHDVLVMQRQHVQRELEAGLTVLGQANLLQQLVRNLLDNARYYSPAGSTITVRVWGRGPLACLEVGDQGPGIPAEQLPRVFDRFWRASPDRSDGGNGLGLAIASRICQMHGGTIRACSALGQGSRFVVELPQAGA